MLTKEQQSLVEANHNLIYKYAHDRNLEIEDYYGILAIGLCKAAIKFESEKGKFSTFAFLFMKSEVEMYWRHIMSSSIIPEDKILSYNADKESDDSDNSSDFVGDFADVKLVEDIVTSEITSNEMMQLLNKEESTIATYLFDGMSRLEIAEEMNCTRQNVEYYIGKIKKKWTNYLLNA